MSGKPAAPEAVVYVCGLITRRAQVDVIVFWWEKWGDKHITDVMAGIKAKKPKEFASLKEDVVLRWRTKKNAAPKNG